MSKGTNPKQQNGGRTRGLELLRRVYDELYLNLGEDYSAVELLKAAQTLIDVTEEEYGLDTYQDANDHPGYYSFAVDNMIVSRSWWILQNERSRDDFSDDGLARDDSAMRRLRSYYTTTAFDP